MANLLLATLVNSSQPMRISEFKRSIGRGIETKELNRLLYGYQERGLAERTVENPPKWSVTVTAASIIALEHGAATTTDDGGEQGAITTQDEQKLFSILMEQGKDHGMSAGSLVAIIGKSIAATNRMLCELEKNTKMIQRSLFNPPVWKMILTNKDEGLTPRRHSSSSESSSSLSESSSSSSERSSSSSLPGPSKQDHVSQIGKIPTQKRTMVSEHPDEPSVAKSLNNNARDREIKEGLSKLHDPKELKDEHEISWANMCSIVVWKKYRRLNRNAKDNDIVEGFIVHENSTTIRISTSLRVIAIGSGTKWAGGDRLSCDGLAVHDSHAEVVARRSLIRWLYSHLQRAGQDDSIAVYNKPGSAKPFQLRPFDLWFYTSLTPCGDSAVYSHGNEEPNLSLCWQGNHCGCFRIKLEAGLGTGFAPKNTMQSIDGLILGFRVMHNSCSDKMAKWSVLGIQGALVSRLIDPVYITGVVVGEVFSHGHICRALCCRSDYALKLSNAALPKPFGPRHPRIRHAPLKMSRSLKTKKKRKSSYNWAEHDNVVVEVVDGTTGRLEDGTDSRICKRQFFRNFTKIHSPASLKSYSENKQLAVPYQKSKKILKDSMRLSFGRWMDKPVEVDEFSVRKEIEFDF